MKASLLIPALASALVISVGMVMLKKHSPPGGEPVAAYDHSTLHAMAQRLANGDSVKGVPLEVEDSIGHIRDRYSDDVAAAESLLSHTKNDCVERKLASGEYIALESGGVGNELADSLLEGIRYLDDGTPVQIWINSGDSSEFDAAYGLYCKVITARELEILGFLEEVEWPQEK